MTMKHTEGNHAAMPPGRLTPPATMLSHVDGTPKPSESPRQLRTAPSVGVPEKQVLEHQLRDVKRIGVKELRNYVNHVEVERRQGAELSLTSVRSGMLSAEKGVLRLVGLHPGGRKSSKLTSGSIELSLG
eukprot:6179813-Pleurochrysis_carterae.AAC.2